jgi:hypothetical protein
MTKKALRKVPVREFVQELFHRIEETQSIDCCREELKKFGELALKHMPDETIEIMWKE